MRVRECTAQLEGALRGRPGGATGPNGADAANGKSTANGAGGWTAGPPRWTMRRPRSGSR